MNQNSAAARIVLRARRYKEDGFIHEGKDPNDAFAASAVTEGRRT